MKDQSRITRKITLVLFLSQGLSSAGFIAAFTVNALVAVDLTGQTAMAGVPGAVYVLGQACGAVVWGFSMEWIGRRRALAFGQVMVARAPREVRRSCLRRAFVPSSGRGAQARRARRSAELATKPDPPGLRGRSAALSPLRGHNKGDRRSAELATKP